MKYARLLFTASGQKKLYGNHSEDEDPDFDSSNDPMMIGGIVCCIILTLLVATPTILKRLGCLPEVQRRRVIHTSANAESMSPEERLMMIDACLISKVCNNNEHTTTSEDSLSETVQTVKNSERSESDNCNIDDVDGYPTSIEDDSEICNEPSPLRDQNETDEEDDVCNICLEPFAEGDELATSNVSNCSHGFHRQCITGWLMKHDECPMCRATFIEKQVHEDA